MGIAAAAFFLPDKVRQFAQHGVTDCLWTSAPHSLPSFLVFMQVSSLIFEPSALNDVLIEPLFQMFSGGMLVSGAVLLVLGVSYADLGSTQELTLAWFISSHWRHYFAPCNGCKHAYTMKP